ncbi:MAG: hypothetical protein AABX39_01970, partial [Nanoarchaeota archaeon]
LWMPESENIERWWVDLKEYNKPFFGTDRDHKDILEVENLRNFIKSEIKNLDFLDSQKIITNLESDLKVEPTDARLHFTLHSPLTLGIINADGLYTGMDPITKEIKEEIPGVRYSQIGEVQFISVPSGIFYTLKLQGYTDGNFSLDIEKQIGNTITDATTFEDISSSITTLATIDIISDFEVLKVKLKVDQDGDGNIDETYPIVKVEIPIPFTPPTPSSFYGGGAPGAVLISQSNSVPITNINILSNIEDILDTEIIKDIEKDVEKEVIKVVDIVKKEKVILETKKEKIEEVVSTENTKEIEESQNIPLTASVTNSNVNNNWLWYVIILGGLSIILLSRKFLKL